MVIDLQPGNDVHQYVRVKDIKDSTSELLTLLVEEIRAIREEAEWEEKTNGMGMEFVRIPSTADLRERFKIRDRIRGVQEPEDYIFYMGKDDQEGGWLKVHSHENRSQREITPFWIGKYEVTQCEWSYLMDHPDPDIREMLNKTDPNEASTALKEFCLHHPDGQKPIVNVTYLEALDFIVALNDQFAKEGYSYRLPSEAEWEYAAQAGTVGERYGQIDDIAWFAENSSVSDEEPLLPELKVGGGRRPNAFGLYDMLGNVWEWTHDVYDRDFTAIRWTFAGLNFVGDKASDVANFSPFGVVSLGDIPVVGKFVGLPGLAYDTGRNLHAQTPDRVLRGGSFRDDRTNVRAAIRLRGEPGLRADLRQRFHGALSIIIDTRKDIIDQIKDIRKKHGKLSRKALSSIKLLTPSKALAIAETITGAISPHLPWAKDATRENNIGFRVVIEGDPQ